MPLTPLHLGPALLLAAVLRKRIHILSLLAGSAIADLEPLFVILSRADYSLHGFFHSFLGITLASLLLALLMKYLDQILRKKASFFEAGKKPGNLNLLSSALIGGYSHVILDSILYLDIQPFYPLDFNPFLGMIPDLWVYWVCLVSFPLAAIAFLLMRMRS